MEVIDEDPDQRQVHYIQNQHAHQPDKKIRLVLDLPQNRHPQKFHVKPYSIHPYPPACRRQLCLRRSIPNPFHQAVACSLFSPSLSPLDHHAPEHLAHHQPRRGKQQHGPGKLLPKRPQDLHPCIIPDIDRCRNRVNAAERQYAPPARQARPGRSKAGSSAPRRTAAPHYRQN